MVEWTLNKQIHEADRKYNQYSKRSKQASQHQKNLSRHAHTCTKRHDVDMNRFVLAFSVYAVPIESGCEFFSWETTERRKRLLYWMKSNITTIQHGRKKNM